MNKWNNLTPEEENIIVHKGVEAPFSGEFDNHWKKGKYVCRRCNASLYLSDSKFDARCGWPAFETELKGAVKHIPDPENDGDEIQCANCGAHLGHVYHGEGFTKTNTRHCVNSISLKFVSGAKK
ncbi:MAG: peptide-methionine (R)-S-oxide reductase [Candidatus Woesearchaeota archaeon]